MPVLYDEICVKPRGILSTHVFRTPWNGRMIKFRLPDKHVRTVVYIRSDRGYVGPYTSLAPVMTDVRGLELLRWGAHVSTAVAVDMSSTVLPNIRLNLNPITAALSSGEKVQLRFAAEIFAEIAVRDCQELLREYERQGFTSVENYVSGLLFGAFEGRTIHALRSHFSGLVDVQALSALDALADEIRMEAAEDVEQKTCGWMRLVGCGFRITAENIQTLMEKDNYIWQKTEEQNARIFEEELKIRVEAAKTQLDMKKRTAEALLEVYKSEPIPREMTEMVIAYLQKFQDTQAADLISICKELRRLSEKTSPEHVLNAVRKLTAGCDPL